MGKVLKASFIKSIFVRLIASAAITMVCAPYAHAAILGEAEVRSYLGEPLKIRIPISFAPDEDISTSCFSVTYQSQPTSLERDLRPSLQDIAGRKILTLQTWAPFNEPFALVVLRNRCAGQGSVSREYTVLLDPRPEISPPSPAVNAPATANTAPNATATPARSDVRDVPLAGTWRAQQNDTLDAIAEGVYPRSIKRKARYIAALRQLNPDLAGIGNKTPLPAGKPLILPDLKLLSSTREVRPSVPGAVLPRDTMPSADASTAATRPRNASSASTRTAKSSRADSAPRVPRPRTTVSPNADAPDRLTLSPTSSAKAESGEDAAVAAAKARAAAPVKPRGDDRFELRLSAGAIDTTRSANITEQERALLRERQLLLDADDQLAQFLSLKNTVKQMENRLNEMQLRLGGTLATNPDTTITAPVGTPTHAVTPASSAKPDASAKVAPKTSATAKSNDAASTNWFGGIPLGWLIAAIVILIASLASVFLVLTWLNGRRRKAHSIAVQDRGTVIDKSVEAVQDSARSGSSDNTSASADTNTNTNTVTRARPVYTANSAQSDSANNLSAADEAQIRAEEAAIRVLAAKRRAAADAAEQARKHGRNNSATSTRAAKDAAASATSNDLNDIPADAVNMPPLTKPVYFDMLADEGSQVISLNDSPSSSVDFPLDDFDLPTPNDDAHDLVRDEERALRAKYMRERYPELQTNTVSLDDPSSLVNAARNYFEESESASMHVSGREKACDLLTYAIEERPQQMRYWLALLEIYRADGMVREFCALAEKFNFLFAQSNAWPLVAAIGHELDPTNPLFASPKPHEAVDPIMLNWLNAPADDAVGALAAEFRIAVLTDFHLTDEMLADARASFSTKAAIETVQ